MKNLLAILSLAILPTINQAQTADIVAEHVLPGFTALAASGAALADTAQADCTHGSDDLRAAYHTAFDDWIAVSHLRFGPTEIDDRAFALAFWPDSRGATPRTLSTLIRDIDPINANAQDYAEVSIAGRGFYALEFLLYDDAITTQGDAAYRCQLIQTVTADIGHLTAMIAQDWQDDYAARLTTPADPYRSDVEALQELFKALNTGAQFTSDMRLGRPLGTFDAPRPKRAEAWRSDRSARNVFIALTALRDLTTHLSNDPDLLAAFQDAIDRTAALDDPRFAGVSDPQNRFRIETIKSRLDEIRGMLATELGPELGVELGFNSLDGD